MTTIPEQPQLTPEQAFEQLQVWYGMQQQLGSLKVAEVLARKRMGAFYFPTPEEGTNRLPLGGGFDLVLVQTIDRKVDVDALNGLTPADLKTIEKLAIPMADLFVQKWELKVGAYRTLNDAQRKFVDKLLDIKPSPTPKLEIVPAADTTGQQTHAAAAEAAAAAETPQQYKYDINIGAEEDTTEGQYFRDADSVWWLLEGEEWLEVTTAATLNELEEQYTAMTAKPKRTRKSRKAGAK